MKDKQSQKGLGNALSRCEVTKDDFLKKFCYKRRSSVDIFWDIDINNMPEMSYIASYVFGDKLYSTTFKSAIEMVLGMLENGSQAKGFTYRFISHNGNEFHNHFIHNELTQYFANYDCVTDTKSITDDNYLISKFFITKRNLTFKLVFGNRKVTFDGLFPLTRLPIESSAKILFNKGLIDDVEDILLATAATYNNYDIIFPGFSNKKKTFTSNVVAAYTQTQESKKRLLLRREGENFEFKRYKLFDDLDAYNGFRLAFHGGLCIYNDKMIAKKIIGKIHGADLNSAYAAEMYNERFPTIITEIKTDFTLNLDDVDTNSFVFCLIDKLELQGLLLELNRFWYNILGKYLFCNHEKYIALTTYHLMAIRDCCQLSNLEVTTKFFVKFAVDHLPIKKEIRHYYGIKTQAKSKNRLIFDDVNDIKSTDELNTDPVDDDLIRVAKESLSALFGALAMRPAYDTFFYNTDGELVKAYNALETKEKNILIPLQITAANFYHLLYPLFGLSEKQLYDNFLYSDTDSLYYKEEIADYVESRMQIHEYNLGAWCLEHKDITEFYILNHKQYIYTEDDKMTVVMSGIMAEDLPSFKSMDEAIKEFFHPYGTLKVPRTHFTDKGVETYTQVITMRPGTRYNPRFTYIHVDYDEIGDVEDGMYLDFGSRQMSMIKPMKYNPVMDLQDLIYDYNTFIA